MRKIVWLLFISFLLVFEVKAKTYYGPYTEFSNYDEKEVIASDLVKVEKESRYRVYKDIKTYDFLKGEEALPSYIKLDESVTEFSNWSLTHSTPQYLTCNLYSYRPLKKVRYLQIANYSRYNVIIEDLFVKDNMLIKKPIDMPNVNININSNEILFLDLNDYYDLENLSISGDIKLANGNKIHVTDLIFNFSIEQSYTFLKYASYTYENIFSGTTAYSFDINKFTITDPRYDSTVKEYCHYDKKYAYLLLTEIVYKDYITKYKYEITDKEYLDGYYLNASDGYMFDLDSEKVFYRYKTRDKIEISDNLVINNKNFNIYDFITTTTNNDIKITSNLNLNINGTYDINFILPFKTVTTTVKVEIIDNYLELISYQNSILKKYMVQNIDLNYNLNLKNIEMKEILNINDININKIKNDLLKCQLELKNLKNKKVDLEIKEINPENNNGLIIFLVVGIILGYLTSYFINKNG